ncbi:MAG: hypothetical protein F6J97_12125 [Leptolyngbya sp. SIO4C1]|nr:hypothetical protein [Leptolyngbya sp. SIO4C1]
MICQKSLKPQLAWLAVSCLSLATGMIYLAQADLQSPAQLSQSYPLEQRL